MYRGSTAVIIMAIEGLAAFPLWGRACSVVNISSSTRTRKRFCILSSKDNANISVITHFSSELTLLKIQHRRRSQMLSGVVQGIDHLISIFSDVSYIRIPLMVLFGLFCFPGVCYLIRTRFLGEVRMNRICINIYFLPKYIPGNIFFQKYTTGNIFFQKYMVGNFFP